jgi:hypothetical protein
VTVPSILGGDRGGSREPTTSSSAPSGYGRPGVRVAGRDLHVASRARPGRGWTCRARQPPADTSAVVTVARHEVVGDWVERAPGRGGTARSQASAARLTTPSTAAGPSRGRRTGAWTRPSPAAPRPPPEQGHPVPTGAWPLSRQRSRQRGGRGPAASLAMSAGSPTSARQSFPKGCIREHPQSTAPKEKMSERWSAGF